MTRKPTPPRAARAIHDAVSSGDDNVLHLPDDWRDDSVESAAAEAANDEPDTRGLASGDDGQDEGDDEDERARQVLSMLRSAPPNLVKAMFALDRAKTDEDIAAARAILRVPGF